MTPGIVSPAGDGVVDAGGAIAPVLGRVGRHLVGSVAESLPSRRGNGAVAATPVAKVHQTFMSTE